MENSLLQKRIINPEIVYQGNNKLTEMLWLFCDAGMNFKNQKHHLEKKQTLEHTRELKACTKSKRFQKRAKWLRNKQSKIIQDEVHKISF